MISGDAAAAGPPAATRAARRVDLTGEVCPFTFVRARLELESCATGEWLEFEVDYPAAPAHMRRSFELLGQGVEVHGGPRAPWLVRVQKRDFVLKPRI